MKDYEINIEPEKVMEEVYRWTANAAVQRGDANAVATSDNKTLLEKFLDDAKMMLADALGRYSTGGLKYTVPEHWGGTTEDVNKWAMMFAKNYCTAKWYELNGTGERFLEMAQMAINALTTELRKRKKY